MSNKQLPATIDPRKWRAGSWSADVCLWHARTLESTQKCLDRTCRPPEEARSLLQDLAESPAMWLALRRHLTVADAVTVLKILHDHSEWPQVRRTEDELLRREYLKLFDECCYFDPDWIHPEMRQQQAARADAARWRFNPCLADAGCACVAEMAVTSRVAFLPASLPSGRAGHMRRCAPRHC